MAERSADIISLPRAPGARTAGPAFGFFVRVGRNDHREMLDLLASGEQGIFGLVIEAQHVERHRELMTEARRRHLDLILDTKTQPMGLPGGHTSQLATLPWGADRHHITSDFDGQAGRAKARRIVEFASVHGFTEILGPTHVLNGPNDQWLRRDIQMMNWVADELGKLSEPIELIYSLAVPMDVLRRRSERAALIGALEDAPCDSIWLKIENMGDDASGEKTSAYIEACRDFHKRGIPIVGDHIGGLPGLGALAFGAVGGMSHGVTMHQSFKASSWRRPPDASSSPRAAARRVYIGQLDMLLKPEFAASLMSSPRAKALCGCRDTHCCPHGIRDMIGRPARHALYQRAREIEILSGTPESLRISRYLDERVRKVSDDVAAVAAMSGLPSTLQANLVKKQGEISRFRLAMAHLAQASPSQTAAIAPAKRTTRK